MMRMLLPLALMVGTELAADTVVPTRTIRPNVLIQATDLALADVDMPNGYDRMADVIGQEARVALYAGRPILVDDIGPPAIVDRNQIVPVHFEGPGISILTEGRVLERGAIGDRVRVMNLSSRATLFGQVMPDGSIKVWK